MPTKESPVSEKSQNEYWRSPVKMPRLMPTIDANQQGRAHEQQRALQADEQHLGHVVAVLEAEAQIAARDLAQPLDVAHRQRIIEAEALAHKVQIFAGDADLLVDEEVDRIAWRQVDQQEDDHRHHERGPGY